MITIAIENPWKEVWDKVDPWEDVEEQRHLKYKQAHRASKRQLGDPPPLHALLHCELADIPDIARSSIQWLSERPEHEQADYLSRLAKRVDERLRQGAVQANTVASIEVLLQFNFPLSRQVILDLLGRRPLQSHHIYAVGFSPRFVRETESADSVGDAVSEVLSLALQNILSEPDWYSQIAVEATHALEAISPVRLLHVDWQNIMKIEEHETTLILESLANSLRSVGRVEAPLLQAVLEQLWSRYSSPGDFANAPGVLARTLEIFGHFGTGLDSLLSKARETMISADVIYLFTQRAPRFLQIQQRRDLFLDAMSVIGDDDLAKQKLLESITEDDYLGIEDALRKVQEHAAS